MTQKTYASGFTLVEVMMAVAIVAILVAVAVPIYQDNVVRTRRTDAQKVLLELENAMERFYTEQTPYSYEDATLGDGGIFPDQAPRDGNPKYYDLSIEEATTSNYELRATPIAGTTQEDDGLMELHSNGVKIWDRDDDDDIAEDSDQCWQPEC